MIKVYVEVQGISTALSKTRNATNSARQKTVKIVQSKAKHAKVKTKERKT